MLNNKIIEAAIFVIGVILLVFLAKILLALTVYILPLFFVALMVYLYFFIKINKNNSKETENK